MNQGDNWARTDILQVNGLNYLTTGTARISASDITDTQSLCILLQRIQQLFE